MDVDTPSSSANASPKSKKSSSSMGASGTSKKLSMNASKKLKTSASSTGLSKTSSSSMRALKKSTKSSTSTDASQKSKTSSSPMSASKKSTKSLLKYPSDRDMFESSIADSNSDNWLTEEVQTLVPEEAALTSELSMNKSSEYPTRSPERIREALLPVPDIYNPNDSLLRIDQNFGVSKSQKYHHIVDAYRCAEPSTISESSEVASAEADIIAGQSLDLSDLSDTSSGSLHVLRDPNQKKYLAPTEDETWNERWYDTRKKISPRRQKKWTIEAIFGKKRQLNKEPQEIKFHEGDLRTANKLWDDFMAKESGNSVPSCSTVKKRKFFKGKSKDSVSKRVKIEKKTPFRRDLSPPPPGMVCVRRKLHETLDSDSDSIGSLSHYKDRLRKRRAAAAQSVEPARREEPNSSSDES